MENAGTLYICPTPIGNLGDISYRLVETLKNVDLIAAEDTRRTMGLLNYLSLSKPIISYYEHNKTFRENGLIEKLKDGKSIAIVTDAGTPGISDPGEQLIKRCADENINIVSLPGPCAAITALVASGISTGKFCFEGFITVNKKQRKIELEALIYEKRTMIFYEAPHKLKNTLNDLLAVFGERKLTLCREITKLHEEFIRTTTSAAVEIYKEKDPKGEYVLILEGSSVEPISEEIVLTPREMLDVLEKDGVDSKEAIARTAKQLSIPKREVYNIYHGLNNGERIND